MGLPVYSSADVKVAWAGVDLEGLAPDSFVSFSYNSDLTDEETGADGQQMISISPDKSGTCTISLQQTSTANLILSGVLNAQKLDRQLRIGSIAITDRSGSVLALLRNCHIKVAPEVSLGITASGNTRQWTFYCQELIFTSTPDGLPINEELARVASAVDTISSSINNS